MFNKFIGISILLVAVFSSCTKEDNSELSPSSDRGGASNSGNSNQSGVMTAGEWNDLDNWTFWDSLLQKESYNKMTSYWSFFTNNRISVQILGNDSLPIINSSVKLKYDGNLVFSTQTDNKGKAELWVNLFQQNQIVNYSKLSIDINNGEKISKLVKPYKEGVNTFIISPVNFENNIEVCFVVDATGSMSDELKYIQSELVDVISRVKSANPNSVVLTSSVFYRDENDEYLTRESNFTTDINQTKKFILDQKAGGGGNFPEAVHSALDKAVNLNWSNNSKTKLLFLLLDAPPHHNNEVITDIQKSVYKAAEKGIKIIPITASGIDKNTEFLMRFFSISTNSTYVFITNHSGIGENHIEASVGKYQVEFLNNLMVRLINKYAE